MSLLRQHRLGDKGVPSLRDTFTMNTYSCLQDPASALHPAGFWAHGRHHVQRTQQVAEQVRADYKFYAQYDQLEKRAAHYTVDLDPERAGAGAGAGAGASSSGSGGADEYMLWLWQVRGCGWLHTCKLAQGTSCAVARAGWQALGSPRVAC